MKYKGRMASVGITFLIQTIFVSYFVMLGEIYLPAFILGYVILIPISYWTGLQYDKAIYFSEKDVLTHLYNRRFILTHFDKMVLAAKRAQRKLYICILDCDQFKQINDIHGHAAGDQVLKSIGEVLIRTLKKRDSAARWGGDEFIIIGEYESERELQRFHQQLEEAFSNMAERFQFPSIVSVGTALYPEQGVQLEVLLKMADADMYERKRKKKLQMTDNGSISTDHAERET
ncbi:GGDEF domain-containing protein [Paenibacillus sp. S-38]|uniref:GGDEF domain-containing protein n=1 Tax=Paenibacillus sp. S-38 TaxID=3416710 RepID=UPI003CEF8564